MHNAHALVESLAGLHTQIRECDGVLDTMESMLRGFQSDLASISAQIKYLQDESLSMNVRLRNRKAAETQLSSFITQIVVPPIQQQLAEAVAAVGRPTVVALKNGRALALEGAVKSASVRRPLRPFNRPF